MKKKAPNAPLSRNILRSLAVIFAANQILHIQENGLAKRPDSEKNVPDKKSEAIVEFNQDILLDISNNDLSDVKKRIDHIESLSMEIIKSAKLGKNDLPFFEEKFDQIIVSFLNSGILEKGVTPHLSFVLMLFTYFVDGKAKKHHEMFDALKSADLYDDIFVKFEDSKVFDWKAHADAVLFALNRGVGLSIAEYPVKEDTDTEPQKETSNE
ncbi:MAG: hypothetical protein PHT07_24075 [Paludibacter sp.]|nr:hypothetical protein [Paludibacter sp.]